MDREPEQSSRTSADRVIFLVWTIAFWVQLGFGFAQKWPNPAAAYGVAAVVVSSVTVGLLRPPEWRGAWLMIAGGSAFMACLFYASGVRTFSSIFLAAAVMAIIWGSKRSDLVPTLLSVIVVCGVAWFSGEAGGPDPFRAWIMQTFAVDSGQAQSVVVAFRKTVHFTAYGVYGLTWRRYGWTMAISQTTILASFDELRQTTSTSRTGSPLDVLLDLSGAIVLLAIADWWSKRAKRA